MSEQWAVHNTVIKNINDLIEYDSNPREHTPEQVEQVANSIREFGWTMPILIDETNEIIAGHGRLMAGKKLGIKEVPCIVAQGWSEEQKKAYCIADNKLTENSTWSKDFLKLNLTSLYDDEFDLALTGFSNEELSKILPDFNIDEGLTDEDDVPTAPEEPVTKLGDIWLCGEHRVMCGDSTSTNDIDKLMIDTYPSLIHTDPPYGMNAVSKSGVLSKNYSEDIMGDDNADVAKESFKLIYSLYPEAKQIWWGANYYCSVLPDSECWLVWDKNNGQSDQTDCELAWANFRSVVRQFTQSSEKINRVHPTQKPVSLIEWIIKRFKLNSESIADFFGGSGSTLISAEKHKIKSFTMEFDTKYCDVIVKRWQNYTGQEATLESDGAKFNDMLK